MKKSIVFSLFLTLSFVTSSCGTNNVDGSVLGEGGQSYYPDPECVNVDMEDLPKSSYLSVPYIDQDYNYCGPASLAMVLSYYGQDVDQEDLGESIVGELGVTTSDLVQRAADYGFRSDVYSCRLETLLYYLSIDVPVIARVVNDVSTNGHFITIIGYDMESKILYVNDPGKYKNTEMSFSSFENIWNVRTLSDDNNSWNQMVVVRP